jgi:membrane protease YdiL (CAAX protease family)
MIALPVVAMLMRKRVRASSTDPAIKRLRYARTIVVLWSVTVLALYALRLHGLGPSSVGLRPVRHPGELALGLVTLVAPLLAAMFGARRELRGEYAQALRAVVPARPSEWLWFVPVAATAGICEEFLYRGYAFTVLTALTGSVLAGVVLSSLAFGLGHAYQGRTGMLGASFTAVLYSLIFLATGSLYPCMLGHFVQDIAGGFVLSRRLYEVNGSAVAG